MIFIQINLNGFNAFNIQRVIYPSEEGYAVVARPIRGSGGGELKRKKAAERGSAILIDVESVDWLARARALPNANATATGEKGGII
ncbi:hypothetical protein SBOR_6248 [Sclerotinia borealis F-4128]|uniref:Uncharacterized protein n=1 Tax=Sclerotinia borealis (strain F-4128) TaxID=1432307 RepID=W9CBZ1_SCLBF|nr:hypothetical protein SBOR_6248 [Sclerotinia borealis F-4128]